VQVALLRAGRGVGAAGLDEHGIRAGARSLLLLGIQAAPAILQRLLKHLRAATAARVSAQQQATQAQGAGHAAWRSDGMEVVHACSAQQVPKATACPQQRRAMPCPCSSEEG
jgi:hypothetical protein